MEEGPEYELNGHQSDYRPHNFLESVHEWNTQVCKPRARGAMRSLIDDVIHGSLLQRPLPGMPIVLG